MGIKIKNQKAAIVNNVEGDQHNYGGQTGVYRADPREALEALGDLRAALRELRLPAGAADEVDADLRRADDAISRRKPEPEEAAGALERLTQTLTNAGALAAASASLIAPLQALGRWLGPLGEKLLSLLPG
ncbi:hypothetical protein J2X85_002249 [Microbacterium trichothecenolyticum]|jgi:hypothetical protein|uniref:hypothetical protein n=1 Tax=Microbacterium trichothecenolyticum TaxID=69370 RepID=UPI00285F01FB|nr:hypothetical protein [Microbacterium trichothecenolyticum]MDR7185215.1 hypothetical protein [Microbacterium trichothecenolyticum]